jgi:hypothetical protein
VTNGQTVSLGNECGTFPPKSGGRRVRVRQVKETESEESFRRRRAAEGGPASILTVAVMSGTSRKVCSTASAER